MKHYATIREARGALALDVGFDPFLVGGWGRCTRQKLAAAGYPVDPTAAAEERRRAAAATQDSPCDRPARDAQAAADLEAMRRVADAVASTGAPVARMSLYGDRTSGVVRLTYRDGRRPTTHRLS